MIKARLLIIQLHARRNVRRKRFACSDLTKTGEARRLEALASACQVWRIPSLRIDFVVEFHTKA